MLVPFFSVIRSATLITWTLSVGRCWRIRPGAMRVAAEIEQRAAPRSMCLKAAHAAQDAASVATGLEAPIQWLAANTSGSPRRSARWSSSIDIAQGENAFGLQNVVHYNLREHRRHDYPTPVLA